MKEYRESITFVLNLSKRRGPQSPDCDKESDQRREIKRSPFRNCDFWEHNSCRQDNTVEAEGEDVSYDLADEEEAVDHIQLLP